MSRRISPEAKAECIRLRTEQRLGSPAIAKQIGISTTTVCAWLKDHPLTKGEMDERRKIGARAMHAALALRGDYVGGADWTESDDLILERLWPGHPKRRIVTMLPGRTWAAISKRAAERGIRRSRTADNRKYDDMDPLFRELREIREVRRVKQQELADKMGIHVVQLRKWERGEQMPRWRGIRDWLDALGCDLKVMERRD